MTTTHVRGTAALLGVFAALAAVAVEVRAHDGPPYPIVSDRVAGSYRISVWTDPDVTQDGSPGGQFWVIVEPTGGGASLPSDTRVSVSIEPLDRPVDAQTVRAEPDGGSVSRRFAALVMDHEGRFAVRVAIAGPMGDAAVEAEVQATYDLRPPPALVGVYLMPFLLIGGLWLKLLLHRRREQTSRSERVTLSKG
jgi:hypothetical protein